MVKLVLDNDKRFLEVGGYKLRLCNDTWLSDVLENMEILNNMSNQEFNKVLAFLEVNELQYLVWDEKDLDYLVNTDDEFKILFDGTFSYVDLGYRLIKEYGDDIRSNIMEVLDYPGDTPISYLDIRDYDNLGRLYVEEFNGVITSLGYFIDSYEYKGKGLF